MNGELIAQLRKERGWSQANLATYAKAGIATVQRAEAGDPDLTYGSAAKLAGALEVPVADIYESDGSPAAPLVGGPPPWFVEFQVDVLRKLEEIKLIVESR